MARDQRPGADVGDAIEEAAAIASKVPKELREAAFHRALDALLGSPSNDAPRKAQASRSRTGRVPKPDSGENHANRLIREINRTEYPEITWSTTALDRSLAMLRIAKNAFEIDGLKASEIAKVLTDKFRVRTTRQRVNQVLDDAGNMVDRIPGGRGGAVYRIMSGGEEFLDKGGSAQKEAVVDRPARGGHRSQSGRSTRREKPTNGTPKTRRTSSGRSPKAAVTTLIDEGYFSEPRAIGAVQDRLRHKKGLSFRLQDLSPALLRLVREGRLDRERDDRGQYEYQAV